MYRLKKKKKKMGKGIKRKSNKQGAYSYILKQRKFSQETESTELVPLFTSLINSTLDIGIGKAQRNLMK